ncbi:flavoprotein [Nocardiopsis kunsanensis]|uniref:flavoprotein n=1 Tax=Nocardiopsis kunsanensis TaxID=141693 RepID=UPI000380D703|nr:flavoprotein [Nocardiopsis kunsanensis]
MENRAAWDPRGARAPEFGAKRLLLVVTGSVAASFLPSWVNWVSHAHPDLACRIVLTASAQRFVTREALTLLTGRQVVEDRWPDEPGTTALHVELADWAEAVAVYPATLDYTARLARGHGDSPSMLALQCASAPIALAAALPPGGWDCAAMRGHRGVLDERANVALIPPVRGLSMSTGRADGQHPVQFPALLQRLEELRSALAGTEDAGTE